MCHVDHELCADIRGDLRESSMLNLAGIRACTRDDQLGFVFSCQLHDLVKVDAICVSRHTVMNKVVELAGGI